jgi:hypothetical protein
MKKELPVLKGLDTVKTFRRIKTKISLEFKDLTSEEILKRLAKSGEEYKLRTQLINK